MASRDVPAQDDLETPRVLQSCRVPRELRPVGKDGLFHAPKSRYLATFKLPHRGDHFRYG
jgi:hypothetical protein